MAALEVTVKDWMTFLADESLDIEIEGLLLEDTLGQEYDYLDEDFSVYLDSQSLLKIHDGVVHEGSESIDLKKYVKSWIDKRRELEQEKEKKPALYIIFEDEATLKQIESVLTSMKVNFKLNIEISRG